jgi:hypothetical protein
MGLCVTCNNVPCKPCTATADEDITAKYKEDSTKNDQKQSNIILVNLSNSINNNNNDSVSSPELLNKKNSSKNQHNLNLIQDSKSMSSTNFELLMLNEINSVRINPKNYSLKLKNLIPMIDTNIQNKKTFVVYDDDIKIELKKGVEAFNECIDFLTNKHTISLEPILFKEELKIPFPKDNINLCLDKTYISNSIENIKENVKNKYEIYDFQYDISPNPVISTIIQVVDDTNANFQRRNNIMSDIVKYVGISFGEVKKGIYCFYLLFGC